MKKTPERKQAHQSRWTQLNSIIFSYSIKGTEIHQDLFDRMES